MKFNFVVLALSALLIPGFTAGAAPYKIGDEVADFSLKNVNGKMVSFADYKKVKGFIVVFTCNHCPFAKKYQDRVKALDKKYATQGFPVIAISSNDPSLVPDDSYDNMIVRAKEQKFTFPYLFDETQMVVKAFGATATPESFVLIKENGKLVLKYKGAIDDNADEPEKAQHHYVSEAVNSLLKGKPVEITQTKSIGCSIKMK